MRIIPKLEDPLVRREPDEAPLLDPAGVEQRAVQGGRRPYLKEELLGGFGGFDARGGQRKEEEE